VSGVVVLLFVLVGALVLAIGNRDTSPEVGVDNEIDSPPTTEPELSAAIGESLSRGD